MNYLDQNLGDIVAADFRAAGIFTTAGIDFCCGGKKSLGQACAEKGISTTSIEKQLKTLEEVPGDPGTNFKDWDPGFLSDYIVNIHHRYVSKSLPELMFYTRKIADVHGGHHPELIEVALLFAKVATELTTHLQQEEQVLFPAIKRLTSQPSQQDREIISSEIKRMSGEHEFVGGAVDQINVITGGYQVPADGCSTYQATMKYLHQFENDLHIHVHLENNILFPKALKL